MLITELQDMRRRGFIPKLPIIISLIGPINYQNPVITNLDGNFNVFVGLDVYVHTDQKTSWHQTIKTVGRLVSSSVRCLSIDRPATKTLIQVVFYYKNNVHDNSWCYDAMALDLPF